VLASKLLGAFFLAGPAFILSFFMRQLRSLAGRLQEFLSLLLLS
jgi:hypothetical protein